jgi:cobalt-zinc-cadmium efflux system outer membrane protein
MRNPRRLGTALALALVCSPIAVFAQTAPLPATVTIDDVLRLMNDRSPRMAADRASIDVAAADRITARTYPNPDISYGAVHLVSGLSTGAVTQHQIVFDQPLLLFKQRAARLGAADLNVTAEQGRVAETIAGRRLEVRQAFATLLSRQQQLAVIQDSLADLQRVEDVVRGRAMAGERSDYDVARIETETERVRVETMNAEADVDDAAGQLATLLGFPGWSPRAMGSLEPSANVPTDVELLWATAQQRRPSLVAIRQQQAAARGGLFLAQRERLPVPAFSAGSQLTHDVTGTSAYFGLSMPLPFFDRGQGAIAKATAEIRAQDLALEAGLAEARADIERATTVLAKRRAALNELETRVVQRVPTLRRMSEDAYREGGADILELLDAMRSVKDIQISHVQQLESAKLAEETVVSVAGLDER